MTDPDWWRQATVCQVYPRAFTDADGDGMGDLAGITSRVGYLRELGVDAAWLSPHYPSPLADGGYDVADHRDVDPRLGTLADFDAMLAALHGAGIRVVVDVVPNHTSQEHPWFRQALASPPGSPARSRHILRDGTGPDRSRPPSSLRSVFGGPAWQAVGDGQFYLHLFDPAQPDLDWTSAEVREDFLTTLAFWADRGVDGFRVDVAHSLVKDVDALMGVEVEILEALPRTDGSHPVWDRDELQDVYAGWRLLDTYDPPRAASASGAARAASGSSCTWTIANHDSIRAVTRYAVPRLPNSRDSHGEAIAWLADDAHQPLDLALGLRRARAAALLAMALPGALYLYQGEEPGLPEVDGLPRDVLQDPVAICSGGAEKGRDGCRVPLPWTSSGPSFGFGTGGADLPQPAWFADLAVEVQDGDPDSPLSLYRRALALRRRLVGPEEMTLVDDPAGAGVIHAHRPGGWRCLTSTGPPPVALPTDTTTWVRVPDDR